jgi:hypothetical protein
VGRPCAKRPTAVGIVRKTTRLSDMDEYYATIDAGSILSNDIVMATKLAATNARRHKVPAHQPRGSARGVIRPSDIRDKTHSSL